MNPQDKDRIAEELHHLARAVGEYVEQKKTEFDLYRSQNKLATKQDLIEITKVIMSAISEFGAKQAAFNDRIDTAITGLQGDVQSLNDLITTLQTSPGAITPEDQATLDDLQTRGQAITDKLEALDALTPPAVPKV